MKTNHLLNRPKTRIALALSLSFLSSVGGAQAADPVTIFTAKKIVTMEAGNPEAKAVAVSGKHIVAAGSLAEVKAAMGDQPYTIDETFKDKVVMPGFIEQHMHPLIASMSLSTDVVSMEDWDLPGKHFKAARTPEEYRSALRAIDKAKGSSNDWLMSWGYHPLWHGKLTRAELDKISRTRPIIVWHRSIHDFYLNTAAIEALKLDRSKMEGRGLASTQYNWDEGHWWEAGAFDMLADSVLKLLASPERVAGGTKMLIAYLHQKGVTSFTDPGTMLVPGLLDMYKKVLGAPDVPFYSHFIPAALGQAVAGRNTEESIAETEKLVAEAPGGKVSMLPKNIKLFADGAIISQAMQMKDGYLDGHKGEWLMTPEQLEKYGKMYWDAGYQLHTHVTGDLGLDVLLDMLERRMRENPRADHRAVIVHFPNSTEEQVARLARLGAIVSSNPYYPVAFAEKFAKYSIGPERANVMTRNASAVKHNLHLSFHSDLPVAPTDPLFLAWSAVNRFTLEGHVVGPEQRISVNDALRAITIEAAYSYHQENELGSIAPGKIANFTVLEQDPYKIKPMALKDVPIWGTVFEGRLFPNPMTPKLAKDHIRKDRRATDAIAIMRHDGADGDTCEVVPKLAKILERNWQAAEKVASSEK